MMISRVKKCKENTYTMVSNDLINDSRLSSDSLSTMIKILSYPDDWKIYLCELKTRLGFGKDRLNTAIRELEYYGYVKRKKSRSKGRFSGYDFEIYESPKPTIQDVSPERVNRSGRTANTKYLNKLNTKKKYTTYKPKIKKDVVVDLPIRNPEVEKLKEKIDNGIGVNFNIYNLQRIVQQRGLQETENLVDRFIEDFDEYKPSNVRNAAGILFDMLMNPDRYQKRINVRTKPSNMTNYKQRTYDDDFYNSLYDNPGGVNKYKTKRSEDHESTNNQSKSASGNGNNSNGAGCRLPYVSSFAL